ncbi:ribonuclease III [Gleimia sp. 6138-11-ORH1]|uniref:ribonuclease III n=1 Tax=Gleimia sp. 6138-11-ORH1 TaxID=2973937 RepID=UPI002167DD96|nr:ribonuclease III [Gleimia sp. 6138-11-ORH1]MCS4484510.1 ribonuclease III [Gleimia sp. 6138-11-ORH1]
MGRKKLKKEAPPPAVNSNLADLFGLWQISFDPELLILALTHRSFAFEVGNLETNERLEFLGDSVLSIIVTEYLFNSYPQLSEANLSRMRGAIVSEKTLAQVARNLKLGDFILLGKGENLTGGRDRDSILCDVTEAMIGATYLTHGLETTRRIVERHLRPFLDIAVELGKTSDYKTTLQEYCAEANLGEPVYEAEGYGPDHARYFIATVHVGNELVGRGQASSKKGAKSEAARAGYFNITQGTSVDEFMPADSPVAENA